MKKLGKLNLKTEKMLTEEELVTFRGGDTVTREEYCQTNCDIIYQCWLQPNPSSCNESAGLAWEEHCEPYGMTC